MPRSKPLLNFLYKLLERKPKKSHHGACKTPINQNQEYYFPDDICKTPIDQSQNLIIIKILLFLPAEDVYNWRSVSKSWYNLIQTPSFIKSHLHNSKPVLLNMRDPARKGIQFPVMKKIGDKIHVQEFVAPIEISIWASCNGLVLYGTKGSKTCELYLANPITRKLRILPPATRGLNSHVSIDGFGLTYISSTKNFIVLHFLMGYRLGCGVLRVGDNAWRRVSTSPYTNFSMGFISRKIIFVDNVAHWAGYTMDRYPPRHVISFDMIQEKFYVNEFSISKFFIDVIEFEGCMKVLSRTFNGKNIFEVWGLNNLEKGGWVREHEFILEGVDKHAFVHTILQDKVIIFGHYDSEQTVYVYEIQLKL